MGGDRIDAEIHEILSGLGFPPERHDDPYSTFSGGWRMRVLLAKMLLTKPDILLLDEPTNHLDLPSIKWLENYLKGFRGICILVSHDRFFMDRMADRIVEIIHSELIPYSGNYSFYLKAREEQMELRKRAYENQQKYLEQQERFINRFRAKNTKAKQVQSKIKQLEKIEKIEAPEEENIKFSIRFEVAQASGKEVLGLKDVGKSYGDNEVLKSSSCEIMRGDKIALIGPNGVGKSTLLRVVGGREDFSGDRKIGHNVSQTFFAQHQLEALGLGRTILEEMQYIGAKKTEVELRTILGCFMFSGDDVEKRIKVLSGGEKSRVALAKTLVSKANFLLLDEPTNHLDIQSIQVLIEALKAYEGTFIVVSHDRYFLKEIANKIWYIDNKQLKSYPGTYEEFEYHQQLKENEGEAVESKQQTIVQEKAPEKKVSDYKAQKQLRNQIRKLERNIEKLEGEIEELEAKKDVLLAEMAKPENAANFDTLADLQKQHDAIATSIDEKTEQWEEMSMELEEINAN